MDTKLKATVKSEPISDYSQVLNTTVKSEPISDYSQVLNATVKSEPTSDDPQVFSDYDIPAIDFEKIYRSGAQTSTINDFEVESKKRKLSDGSDQNNFDELDKTFTLGLEAAFNKEMKQNTEMKQNEPPEIEYSSRFKFTCPDLTDPTLPNDLKLLFQPLYCKLCSMMLTSNSMARLHYSSKRHNKNIKLWLVNYASSTGTLVHPRALLMENKQPQRVQVQDVTTRPLFCEVCKIPFNGVKHAESHYMGKAHHKKLARFTSSSSGNTGVLEKNVNSFNNTNEKPRCPDKSKELLEIVPHYEPHLKNMSFSSSSEEENVNLVSNSIDKPESSRKRKVSGEISKYFDIECKICSVKANIEQMTAHLQGMKHLKNYKKTVENIRNKKK